MEASRFAAYKLPPGRHGLSREHVAESQRWRLLGAAADLLAESGYRSLTTHMVAARAAVSSQTFYVHFGGLDDCLRAAFEAAIKFADRSGEVADAVGLLAGEPSLAALFGLEARAAVPDIVPAFAAFAESLAPQPRGRLLFGAALALLLDQPAGQGTESAERAREVTALVDRLGNADPRQRLPLGRQART